MPPVLLNSFASTFLVAFYVLTALILLVLLGAMVFLIVKLNALLEKYEQKIDPLLAKADIVLTLTTEKVTTIGTKAEEILTQSEELTELVHSRVDSTTFAVQKTVFTPLIGVNSLIAGLKRGAQTFARRQQETLITVISDGADSIVAGKESTDSLANYNSDINKTLKFRETANLTASSTVNNMVNNEALPELLPVGPVKEK